MHLPLRQRIVKRLGALIRLFEKTLINVVGISINCLAMLVTGREIIQEKLLMFSAALG